MSDWLVRKSFVMHSGATSDFKVECDGLTNEEIETFALLIAKRFRFRIVDGIPAGGFPIANALQKYCSPAAMVRLIVDDVLTTGASMNAARHNGGDIGVVLSGLGSSGFPVLGNKPMTATFVRMPLDVGGLCHGDTDFQWAF